MVKYPYTITKYKDRKLYDLQNSCYILLSDVITKVKNKDSVKVKNYEGKDITLALLVECYCVMLRESSGKEYSKFMYNKLIRKMRELIQGFNNADTKN